MRSILFLLAVAAQAESLADKIAAHAADPLFVRKAYWGAKFVRLSSGEVVFAQNDDKLLTPASNTKLFATALALNRLGAGYRMTTRVVAAPNGDLVLVGGGDPTLSGRAMPYQHNSKSTDSFAPLDDLASQVWDAGVRRVRGDVIGDDTAYVYEPYPEGWAVDDAVSGFGAAVSALILHDNEFLIRVQGAAEAGSPAHVTVDPPGNYLTLINRVRTSLAGPFAVNLDRKASSSTIDLWGSLKPGSATLLDTSVDDPARYAAFAFREALLRRGIAVDGGIRVRHRLPGENGWSYEGARELAKRQSPPISQLIQVTNKVSQNLWAEILLREVARVRTGNPSRQGGLDALKRFLTEIGVEKTDYNFEDGSGLSRLTLVSPAAIVSLLRSMDESKARQVWLDSLPVGGEDGSLGRRFQEGLKGRVLAKTGTLSHVTALSGYLEPASGDRLAFSVIINHANASTGEIRRWVDKLVQIILNGV